ncbi:NIF domain-containing protein [Histoplasma capsulatum G186AR]|uniref:NIF domain-containing protein n=1 Tax=Ajellomyces capsulatus TaxID=5037 RepID=A0A8H8CZR0_AJECA|nr:NIF domain-containing protein [Histoplasma capsulatum]QSS74147.1 NIF domain-containing protein [Histoplasma capsulatum G186AR]
MLQTPHWRPRTTNALDQAHRDLMISSGRHMSRAAVNWHSPTNRHLQGTRERVCLHTIPLQCRTPCRNGGMSLCLNLYMRRRRRCEYLLCLILRTIANVLLIVTLRPVAGASRPLPWVLPTHSHHQYQQQQYQSPPFQHRLYASSFTIPFTPINRSTIAAPRALTFHQLQQHHHYHNHFNSGPLQSHSSGSNLRSQTSTSPRSVTPPTAASATTAYITQSSSQPTITTGTRPLLIILDLNGTLIHRIGRRPLRFKTRPGLYNFINELFENYTVMVWTSSRPQTVREVLERTFVAEEREKFVAVWARDTLGLNAKQYAEKVQVYKRLDKVWGHKGIARSYPATIENESNGNDEGNATTTTSTTTATPAMSGGDVSVGMKKKKKKKKKGKDRRNQESSGDTPWNQTNTLLIDDSALKALAQPYNIIEIPEFANEHPPAHEEKVLDTVLRQLRVLSRHADVSCKVREWEELRRGLQRQHQRQEGKSGGNAQEDGNGHGHVEAHLPKSHSREDIERFWDLQLARDEEAIRRMDGRRDEDEDKEEGGAGNLHTVETDVETAAISIPHRQGGGEGSQGRIQKSYGDERTPSPTQREHSRILLTERRLQIHTDNEEAGVLVEKKNHVKKQKKAARRDVTAATDAITLTGEEGICG